MFFPWMERDNEKNVRARAKGALPNEGELLWIRKWVP